jgi:conserved oligomeric Golgi complex subunit 7
VSSILLFSPIIFFLSYLSFFLLNIKKKIVFQKLIIVASSRLLTLYFYYLLENMQAWINSRESMNDASKRQMLLDDMSRESVRVRELVRLRTEGVISGVVGSVRTVESVRVHANALRTRLLALDARLAQLEQETSNSVLDVARLDAVRDKMKRCVDSLAAAERVALLANEMEQLFSSAAANDRQDDDRKDDDDDDDSLHQIAMLVVDMRGAVQLLVGTARHADEAKRLERLERRLDTMCAPRVRVALAQHDVDEARRMLRVYSVVGRVEHFEALYDAHWKRRVIDDCWALYDDGDDADRFVRWLAEHFCATLVGVVVDDEVCFAAQLFDEEPRRRRRLLCRAAAASLRSVHRSFAERIDGASIDAHIRAHQCLDAKLLRPLLASIVSSDDDDESEQLRRALLLAVFEPLHAAQCGYADAERERVERELAHVERAQLAVIDAPPTLLDHVKQSAPQLLAIAQQAFSRCMALTGGTEADRTVDALGALLGGHLSRHQLGVVLPALRQGIADAQQQQQQQRTESNGLAEQHDWHHFQSSLQLLQVAIDFGHELRALDRHMRSSLSERRVAVHALTPFTSHLTDDDGAQRRAQIDAFFAARERALLGDANDAFNAWHSACEAFAFDCMFAFIQQTLARVPAMSHIWAAAAPDDASTPQPSAYILHIKEHLLSLPEQLEPFALAQQRRSPAPNLFPQSPSKHDDNPGNNLDDSDDNDSDDDDISTGFVYQWLATVSRGTMSEFEKRIGQIPKLSSRGARQLMLDIRYLSNIFDAIGIAIKSSLSTIAHALSLPASQRASFVDANRHSSSLHLLRSLFSSIEDDAPSNQERPGRISDI